METTIWGLGYRVFPKLGVHFGGSHHKDYRILGSILGSLIGKLPHELRTQVSLGGTYRGCIVGLRGTFRE